MTNPLEAMYAAQPGWGAAEWQQAAQHAEDQNNAIKGFAVLRAAGLTDDYIKSLPHQTIIESGLLGRPANDAGGGYGYLGPAATMAGINSQYNLGRANLAQQQVQNTFGNQMQMSQLASNPFNIVTYLDALKRTGTVSPLNQPSIPTLPAQQPTADPLEAKLRDYLGGSGKAFAGGGQMIAPPEPSVLEGAYTHTPYATFGENNRRGQNERLQLGGGRIQATPARGASKRVSLGKQQSIIGSAAQNNQPMNVSGPGFNNQPVPPMASPYPYRQLPQPNGVIDPQPGMLPSRLALPTTVSPYPYPQMPQPNGMMDVTTAAHASGGWAKVGAQLGAARTTATSSTSATPQQTAPPAAAGPSQADQWRAAWVAYHPATSAPQAAPQPTAASRTAYGQTYTQNQPDANYTNADGTPYAGETAANFNARMDAMAAQEERDQHGGTAAGSAARYWSTLMHGPKDSGRLETTIQGSRGPIDVSMTRDQKSLTGTDGKTVYYKDLPGATPDVPKAKFWNGKGPMPEIPQGAGPQGGTWTAGKQTLGKQAQTQPTLGKPPTSSVPTGETVTPTTPAAPSQTIPQQAQSEAAKLLSAVKANTMVNPQFVAELEAGRVPGLSLINKRTWNSLSSTLKNAYLALLVSTGFVGTIQDVTEQIDRNTPAGIG